MEKQKLGPQPLLYPMPAVLVGAMIEGRPNFMTAAWCGIVAFKPPALTVGINKERYTLKGIELQGAFSVNVPSTELVKKVDFCGIYSGKKKDKSQVFKVFYGLSTQAPLIEECPVNLECQVRHVLDGGSHLVIMAEIMETHLSDHCFKAGKPDPTLIDPLMFALPDQHYYRVGEVVARAFHVGKELNLKHER